MYKKYGNTLLESNAIVDKNVSKPSNTYKNMEQILETTLEESIILSKKTK